VKNESASDKMQTSQAQTNTLTSFHFSSSIFKRLTKTAERCVCLLNITWEQGDYRILKEATNDKVEEKQKDSEYLENYVLHDYMFSRV